MTTHVEWQPESVAAIAEACTCSSILKGNVRGWIPSGYCGAEGAGLVVIYVSDAIRDGDRVHGVIGGDMGAGNMASPRSIDRPHGLLQSLSLTRAVTVSGIDPCDIR
jgi:hypothetical protein